MTEHRAPAEGDVYAHCEVYREHGACVCSTGYPASCQAQQKDPSTEGWTLHPTCPKCGAGFRYLNGTQYANKAGFLVEAILTCDPCSTQWNVTARLQPFAWTSAEVNSRSHNKVKGIA